MASIFDIETLAAMNMLRFPQSQDYDMPGFTDAYLRMDPRARTGIDPFDKRVHFTDPWKLPSHESFSNESMYAGKDAPSWKSYKVPGKGEYFRLEKPTGEVVAWDSPWLQGASPSRLEELKDYSAYGIDNYARPSLSALYGYGIAPKYK